MNQTPQGKFIWRRIERICVRSVRTIVFALTYISAVSVFVMIAVTCADVLLRLPWINRPFVGAFDIVRIAGAVTLAAALPYTTAVKGHVAIEYFFHKLNHISRIIVDSVMRLLSITLFGFLGWRSVLYGTDLYHIGQVSQTLRIPIFWVPIFIGFCCFVVVLVVVHHLIYPQREMIKL